MAFNCKEAHLGLATTRELLIELEVRGRVTEMTDTHLSADAEELKRETSALLTRLSSELLNYRTVDGK